MLHRVVLIVVLLACAGVGCSRSDTGGSGASAAIEEPWSHAYSGDPNGWWVNWSSKLKVAPFATGTRFEFEAIEKDGSRSRIVFEVRSVKPEAGGSFQVELAREDGAVQRASVPPRLQHVVSGGTGFITSRNGRLVSVTVPAGTFLAGRLWSSERRSDVVYERDEWVVPDVPFPIQIWSRPVSEKQLYDTPADGTVPPGTSLWRLVRIAKN